MPRKKKEKTMKVFLLKPTGKPEVLDFPVKHDYKDVKKALGIESPITVVERKIGKDYYDIWLDDEGLLKEGKQLAGACLNARELLVGPLMIARHDGKGNMTGLSEDDIAQIKRKDNLIEKDGYLCYMKTNRVVIADPEFGEIALDKGGYFLAYSV